MSIEQSMAAIDRAVEESLDAQKQYERKQKGRSQREAYEKSIREVRRVAGKTEASELTEWIENRIREKGKLPSSRNVRKQGAKICRETGHSVSTNDWLGS